MRTIKRIRKSAATGDNAPGCEPVADQKAHLSAKTRENLTAREHPFISIRPSLT